MTWGSSIWEIRSRGIGIAQPHSNSWERALSLGNCLSLIFGAADILYERSALPEWPWPSITAMLNISIFRRCVEQLVSWTFRGDFYKCQRYDLLTASCLSMCRNKKKHTQSQVVGKLGTHLQANLSDVRWLSSGRTESTLTGHLGWQVLISKCLDGGIYTASCSYNRSYGQVHF